MDFPQLAKEWYLNSNTVVVVAAKDLQELENFAKALDESHVKHSKFREPDVNDELTAIALVPSPESKKLCSKFKLAGK